MRGTDVSGRYRRGKAVSFIRADRLCRNPVKELYDSGLDFVYPEKVAGAGIAVYGTAADAESI